MNELEIGKIYDCIVRKIAKTYIIIEYKGIRGLVHISEVSDYLIRNLENFFKLNTYYSFLLITKKDNNYFFSYKRINAKLLKKRSVIIPSRSGFEPIYKLTIEKMC
ncbi:MAG: hypothetical protein LBB39_03675 [Mycoplasmataceae bacterium]|jgi:predicted RNA-binding protein with RPS1 domain|nr:hypothetical protein [Mycoplasmataceae bacterium]